MVRTFVRWGFPYLTSSVVINPNKFKQFCGQWLPSPCYCCKTVRVAIQMTCTFVVWDVAIHRSVNKVTQSDILAWLAHYCPMDSLRFPMGCFPIKYHFTICLIFRWSRVDKFIFSSNQKIYLNTVCHPWNWMRRDGSDGILLNIISAGTPQLLLHHNLRNLVFLYKIK